MRPNGGAVLPQEPWIFRCLAGEIEMSEPKPEIVHEDECITIWYHSLTKIIHHQVHKALRGEAYRQAFVKGTEALRKYGAQKWLSDDRRHFILPQEDQEWANAIWFPATRDAGWKYWAIIMPDNAVTVLFLRRFAAQWSAAGVATEVFTSPDPALEWLVNAGPAYSRRGSGKLSST